MVSHIKRDCAAITAGIAPRIFLDAEEIASRVVIYEFIVFQINLGGGVGDIKCVALISSNGGIFRSECSLTGRGVSTHGLVEEDVFIGGGLTIEGIIRVGQSYIF